MATMPKPCGPEDERFVYVVTAAGVEVLRRSALTVDSETPPESELADKQRDPALSGADG